MYIDPNSVLLIEDNEIVNFYNYDLLTDLEWIEKVETRSSVLDAFAFLEAAIEEGELPGLWLIDVNLPDGQGFDFIRHAMVLLQDEVTWPDMFILTTSIHHKDRAAFETFPFLKGYLEKPLEEEIIRNYFKEKTIIST